MKKMYTNFLIVLSILLLSATLYAQSANERLLEELESGRLSDIAAQNGLITIEGGGGILIVQDSGGGVTAADSVEKAVLSLGLPYTRVLSAAAVALGIPALLTYDAVFWLGTTNTGAELDSCTAYLAAGGNLLVWDGDEAYFYGDTSGTGTSTPLFDNYFQAALVSDEGSDGICVGEDIMTGIDIDISLDPWPDDVILTGPNSVKIFNAAVSNNVAGLRASDGTFRATLLCWDPDYVSTDSTLMIVQKAYDFLVLGIIPVELTSFAVTSNGQNVVLNWTTATETNNSGFNVERKSNNGNWETISFVAGFGTTTETKAYSYSDNGVAVGTYSYRLKQLDFNGTFEYSNEVNVDVNAPASFSLDQNYPNPFNPSTLIKYSVAQDGFVNVSVFNLIGEKVATLVNNNMQAGSYEVNFNAGSLSSGVYLYSIEAGDFKAVRKMMLMK